VLDGIMAEAALECASSAYHRSRCIYGLELRHFQFCAPKIEVRIGRIVHLSRHKKTEKNNSKAECPDWLEAAAFQTIR
jgi:hypothetical protein